LDIKGFLASLQEAQNAAAQSAQKVTQSFNDKMKDVGQSMQSVGKTLSLSVTAPLAAMGGFGLKIAADFEKGMSEVRAISGATGEQFQDLRKTALDLGASTAFSAKEVASAMTEMAKAGWNSQQIIDGMSGVLDAAAASGEGLASVSTIIADAVTTFGLQASESSKIADLLTQAANSGTIGMSDLGESFKMIGPVANTMNFDISEVTTALTALSQSGIKGSLAGTGLRSAFLSMVSPSKEAQAALDQLGITLAHSDGTFKSLDQILRELRVSFSGLTEEQKTQTAEALAGRVGMSSLVSILNMTQESYDSLTESMKGSNGVAQETASVMQDNFSSAMEQLGGALETLAITVADLFLPMLRSLVVYVQSWVEWFTALSPSTQQAIVMVAAFAAALGPVVLALGTFITSITTIVSVIPTLITALSIIPTAIGGISIAFASVYGAIATGFVPAIFAAEAAVARLGIAFIGLLPSISTIASTITSVFLVSLGSIGVAVGAVITALQGLWAIMLANPITAIAVAIAALVAGFVYLWNNCEGFRTFWIELWQGIKIYASAAADWMIAKLSDFGSWISTTWTATWTGFKEFFVGLWESIKSWFSGIIEWFFTTISSIGTKVGEAIGKIKTIGQSLMNEALSIGKGIVDGVWKGIQNASAAFYANVTGFFKGIIDRAKRSLGIASPSKVFADAVGHWIPLGIADGFEDAMSLAYKSMQSALDAGMGALASTEVPIQYAFASSNAPTGGGYQEPYAGGTQTEQSGGNTYNFYSPEPITEAQARREFEQLNRNMAYGF
jgi:TP901 family phage tail tape measure protein